MLPGSGTFHLAAGSETLSQGGAEPLPPCPCPCPMAVSVSVSVSDPDPGPDPESESEAAEGKGAAAGTEAGTAISVGGHQCPMSRLEACSTAEPERSDCGARASRADRTGRNNRMEGWAPACRKKIITKSVDPQSTSRQLSNRDVLAPLCNGWSLRSLRCNPVMVRCICVNLRDLRANCDGAVRLRLRLRRDRWNLCLSV